MAVVVTRQKSQSACIYLHLFFTGSRGPVGTATPVSNCNRKHRLHDARSGLPVRRRRRIDPNVFTYVYLVIAFSLTTIRILLYMYERDVTVTGVT